MSQPVGDFIATRRVGNAGIAILCESYGAGVPRFNVSEKTLQSAVPEFAATGEITAAMTTTIIQVGESVIVIDPALDDPESRLARAMSAQSSWVRSPGLQIGFDQLGISNDQVTQVIITHAHFDHCLGVTIEREGSYVPRFPTARYFLGRAEWQQKPDQDSIPPTPEENRFEYLHHVEMWPRLQAIHDAGLLELVEGSPAIAPGVELLHAPGETPGHYVVRLDSNGEVFYHLGDLVHGWFEFEHPGWIVVDSLERDVETMERTRLQLMPRVAGEHAVAVYGHGPLPGWGRLVANNGGFRWESI